VENATLETGLAAILAEALANVKDRSHPAMSREM
jgi:hypothetical protein